MRGSIPESGKVLAESMHMRKYQERQYRLEARAKAGDRMEQEQALEKRDTLRSTLQEKMAMSRCVATLVSCLHVVFSNQSSVLN